MSNTSNDTVSFKYAEVSAILDGLTDAAEIVDDHLPTQPDIAEKLKGLTRARELLGAVMDELYRRQNPSWNPDAVDDGLRAGMN
jgi:hypothetical protein